MGIKIIPPQDPIRLKRVHDAKVFATGVDVDSLAAQKKKKEAQHQRNQEDKRLYGALLAAQSAAAQARSAVAAVEGAKVAQDILRYRQQQQGLSRARDWDLSWPDRLRANSPARVGDDDLRCGPASLQKFAGEDLEYQQRKAEQEGVNRDVWHAQAECTLAARASDKAALELEAEEIRTLDESQKQLMAAEEAALAAENLATFRTNKGLSEEMRAREQAAHDRENAAKEAEVQAALNSHLLLESPLAAVSALSPYRVRKDHWKGMSAEQAAQIRQAQEQQKQEKATRLAEDLVRDEAANQAQAMALAAAEREALRADDQKKNQRLQVARNLTEQILEKQARDRELAQLHANSATPAYFAQFETSHR